MKSILHTVAAAALLGCLSFSASALDAGKAVAAQFHVSGSNKPTEFTPITAVNQGSKKGGMFGDFAPIADQEYQWQVLNIPVRVGAGKTSVPGGDKAIPNNISEITFHVYVRVEASMVDKSGKAVSDKRKSCITLEKEITYVNIPLKKAGGSISVGTANVDSYADMMVAVFLSPSDVARITEDETSPNTSMGGKTQPKVKVAAVAIEASYKGTSCWRTPKGEKTPYLVCDSTACNGLSDRWWKSTSGSTKGASLSCISETPFAAQYYPYYCATKPLYGEPATSGSVPAADDSSSGTSADDSSSDDSSATDTTDTDASDTEGDSSSKGGKRGKKDKKKK